MEFDLSKRMNRERLIDFSEKLEELNEQIGFKVSSRGWCYQLEGFNLITKDQFDLVERWINTCRKKGFLAINFTAEEEGRKFSGVEKPESMTPIEYMKQYLEATLECQGWYTPNWWDGEEYYIQMVVEKIDLKTLFFLVCKKHHIPVATCFDSKTEILTESGWKKFTEITKEDKVATLDKSGLIYQKPIRIINQKYEGEMYHIKNRATDQLITPNHNVFVQRQRYNKKNLRFELIPIEKVAHLKNLKLKKDISWKGKEQKYFELPHCKYHPNAVIKEKLDMDLWLQFLGYYLSEGSLNHKIKNSIYIIQLAQKKKSHPETYQRMKKCIKKLGYNFYADYQAIQLSNKQLFYYLKKFGKCNEKYIPRELLNLSPRQLNILLNALIEGDGHKRGNRAVYVTTSKQLADNVQELALKAGFYASISFKLKSNGIIKGRKIKSEHQCYCVNICKGRSDFCINHGKRDYQIIHYKGTIHCVEVSNGIIYVRRNGKPVWSGNSKGWSSMLQRAEYARRFKEAEDKGLKCVLIYCGDHDPDGLRISDFLRKNLADLSEIEWEDDEVGYDPCNLIIDRFGLDYDFIEANRLSWINNLITGSGKNLASPSHKNHFMEYVQDYLKRFGARKCEANALVIKPQQGRELCRKAIEKYLGKEALQRFNTKRRNIINELDEFRKRTGLDIAVKEALTIIEVEQEKEDKE